MAEIFTLFEDVVFGPEQLQAMGEAFDQVKRVMPEADPYEIAAAIIRHARDGTSDASILYARIVRELGAAKSA